MPQMRKVTVEEMQNWPVHQFGTARKRQQIPLKTRVRMAAALIEHQVENAKTHKERARWSAARGRLHEFWKAQELGRESVFWNSRSRYTDIPQVRKILHGLGHVPA